MYTIADGGGPISDADISIEQERITQITTTLSDALTRVTKGAHMARVPAESLGAAPTALELELHAGKAHGEVVGEMERTITGLQSYRKALDGFVADVEEQDADQAQRLTAIEQGVACIAQPTFNDDAAQCVAPGDDS